MKFLFLCEKNKYKFFYEYLVSIKKYIDYDIILFLESEEIKINQMDCYDFYIFIQKCPINISEKSIKNNFYILNTEQLTNTNIVKSLNMNIIDYSLENIYILKDIENYKKNIIYFPYTLNKGEIYDYQKEKGVCFIGGISNRRIKILSGLKNLGIDVSIVNKKWFGKQNQELFKHKILLNIHYGDNYKIYESFRCDRCIFNKMIVVSEISLNDCVNIFNIKKKIIFEKYENLISKVNEVYNNYDEYYKEIFKDYDIFIDEYQKYQDNIYSESIKKMIIE
jgi:hypothetical protein